MDTVTPILFAIILRVIDGDTFKVNLPCDIEIVCKNVPIRLKNIDTPELRGKCPEEAALALKAKQVAMTMLTPGKTVPIVNPQRDNYFRLDVSLPLLEKQLLEQGLARPYNGGKRKGWC